MLGQVSSSSPLLVGCLGSKRETEQDITPHPILLIKHVCFAFTPCFYHPAAHLLSECLHLRRYITQKKRYGKRRNMEKNFKDNLVLELLLHVRMCVCTHAWLHVHMHVQNAHERTKGPSQSILLWILSITSYYNNNKNLSSNLNLDRKAEPDCNTTHIMVVN